MKTRNIFFLISVLFLATNLYGQDYFMYVGEEKHIYKVSPNKMLVQHFDSSIDSVGIRNSFQRNSVKARKITKLPMYPLSYQAKIALNLVSF